MFKGFKEFLLRGNVVDLAVAVVIGAAFGAVVDKFVSALINPIIGMVFQADSLDGALKVALPGGGALAFGEIIGALINFVAVAFVVYFAFVLPMNKLRKPAEAEPEGATQEELLAEIRDLLAQQGGAAAAAPAPGNGTPDAPGHRH
ncbi:large conductance mechanosensitive channel protein MscL [Leucobacter luti]|uniref:large conductance mechanosensitive channel protein MscL n=1 Tax=Leucobacter luti TaxID=340320 RepID=UPI003D02E1EE